MSDVVAETRKGRNVVNLKPKAALAIVRPIGVQDDSIAAVGENRKLVVRSEEHTSELQSLMRTSYAVFCLKKTLPSHPAHKPLHTSTRHLSYTIDTALPTSTPHHIILPPSQ